MRPRTASSLGQRGRGDRHVYASQMRFIPARLLGLFYRTTWPLAAVGGAGLEPGSAHHVGLPAVLGTWRCQRIAAGPQRAQHQNRKQAPLDRRNAGRHPVWSGDPDYLLSNRFYNGEVKYKNEILPGEQPPIMERELFEAVRQKSLAQWSHRTVVRNKSDQLLTGLLFDDAGHRMIPTHATKAGIRYRYYASAPVLHGEAKTAPAGSVTRVPAADIEDTVLKSLEAHFAGQQDVSTSKALQLRDRPCSVGCRDCCANGQASCSTEVGSYRRRTRSLR
jgi:hypothetical protein